MDLGRLPFLPFEKIFKDLDLIDVFNLASLSRRLELQIISVTAYQKGIQCDIKIRSTRRSITLRKEGEKEFTWSLHARRDYWAADATDFIDGNWGGRVWRVSPHELGYRIFGINDDSTLFWVHYLRTLFNLKIDSLIYEKSDNPLIFDKLFVKSTEFHVATYMKLDALSLSDQQITFIFDNFKAHELTLIMDDKSTYNYRKCAYQFDNMYIHRAFSITVGDVWVMCQRCESVQAFQVKCGWWELNKLIRDWLDSDNQKLKRCMILSIDVKKSMKELFKGTTAIPGSMKRPSASRFYMNNVKYECGMDIRRKDGKIATVCLDGYFIFTVWDVPNPNHVY